MTKEEAYNFDFSCSTCKYFAQGKNCSYCAHETPIVDKGNYVYYNFSCHQKEHGLHKSRILYMDKSNLF